MVPIDPLGIIDLTIAFSVASWTGFLFLVWYYIGGLATKRSLFISCAYFSSVISVILIFPFLAVIGIFNTLEPELYAKLLDPQLKNQPMPDLSGSIIPDVSLFFIIFCFILMLILHLRCWGAYRQLSELGKVRSCFALIITVLFGWPIPIVAYLITSAFMG